jgi:hypothetical protein
MNLLTDLLKPVLQPRNITGLTGGGLTKLDGIPTVDFLTAPQTFVEFVLGDIKYIYYLRAGTDAESSPAIIRPDDYAGGTNEKVWVRLVNLTALNNLGDLVNPATARDNLSLISDAITSAVTNTTLARHNSSGTPAVGFGTRGVFKLKSSTTDDQEAAAIKVRWVDATHATRQSEIAWDVVDQGAIVSDAMVLGKYISGGSRFVMLGINTIPLRSLHVAMSDPGAITIAAFENTDTTNLNGGLFNFRGTTTGAGATTFQAFASIKAEFTEHNHATRKGTLELHNQNGDITEVLKWKAGYLLELQAAGSVKTLTGDLLIGTGAANGNINLTPHGTGLINLNASPVITIADAVTNAVTEMSVTRHNSSGTPAAGFGIRSAFKLKSSTTDNQDAAQVDVAWIDATHATRSVYWALNLTDNAAMATNVLHARGVSNGTNRDCCLGIGTIPIRPLHILTNNPVENGQCVLENSNTTDTNSSGVSFRTTSTGAGAIAQTELASIKGTFNTHNHATRTSQIKFSWFNSSVAETLFISPNNVLQFVGAGIFGATTGNVTLRSFGGNGSINLVPQGTGVVQYNSTQILTARKAGWTVATGTATRTTFDTATVTLSQLAERVKALIDDLHQTAGHGLIGT